MSSSLKTEMWRTWSAKRAGLPQTEFEGIIIPSFATFKFDNMSSLMSSCSDMQLLKLFPVKMEISGQEIIPFQIMWI